MAPLAIYAATVLAAIFAAVVAPTRQALIPTLIVGAMAMGSFASEVGDALGPIIGGIVLSRLGAGVVRLFDAASFAAVALALVVLRTHAIAPLSGPNGGTAALDALRFLGLTPVLPGLMGLDVLATVFGASSGQMLIFARQILGDGPQTHGWLFTAPVAGSLPRSLGMALACMPRRAGGGVIVAVAVYGAALPGCGPSRTLWLSLRPFGIGGAAGAVGMVLRQAPRNLTTPDARRPHRCRSFAMGGAQLGEFESGPIAAAVDAPFAVADSRG